MVFYKKVGLGNYRYRAEWAVGVGVGKSILIPLIEEFGCTDLSRYEDKMKWWVGVQSAYVDTDDPEHWEQDSAPPTHVGQYAVCALKAFPITYQTTMTTDHPELEEYNHDLS